MRLFRHSGKNIETIGLDGHFADLISQPAEFVVECVPHGTFIPSDRFDINQVTRKRNDVHAGENTAIGCGATGVPARRREAPASFSLSTILAPSLYPEKRARLHPFLLSPRPGRSP